MKSTSILSPD